MTQQPIYNLENFKLVMPIPSQFVSYSELRINEQKIFLTAVAAAELGWPEHICVLISEDGMQVAITPSEKTEYSIPFIVGKRNDYRGGNKQVPVHHGAIAKVIRSQMGWRDKTTYRVPGYQVQQHLLVFNLSEAYSQKQKRKSVKLTPEQLFNSYPTWETVANRFKHVPLGLPSTASDDGNMADVIDIKAV